MTILSEIRISHESRLPLHVQLSNQISYSIRSGRLQPGSRLPSELELHNDLKISRTTVRHAFRDMELAGLIERIPGKGTFVSHRTPYNMDSGLGLILFLVNEFSSEFECCLLRGIESVAKSQGYQAGLFTFGAANNIDQQRVLKQILSGRKVGAVIWPHLDSEKNIELVQLVSESYTPTVVVDRGLPELDSDHVTSDNYHGAAEAIEHLIDLGHREIVFLSHKYLSTLPVAERLRGYRDALTAREIAPTEPWIVGEVPERTPPDFAMKHSANVASSMVQKLASRLQVASPRPTAIFAVSDHLALTALYASKAANIKVPEELSIVGFDDSDFARYLEIPLTTVAQNMTVLGKRAAKLLIERMEGYQDVARWENVPVELRVRKSTAALSSYALKKTQGS